MNIKDFIQNFANTFDVPITENLSPDTIFKELEEWSSMSLVFTISMIDEEYGVTIDDSIIRQNETLEDLFNAVKKLQEEKERK